MLYLFLFFSFDIQPAEADSLQTIYFQLSPGHSVAVRHRCSNFPLDSILSHMHIETALKKKKNFFGRRNCLEDGNNYVNAIKQTRST